MSYTRIPNDFIDNLKLNPYQFQILSIIVRKTDGWCKVEDGISLSQFEKLVTFSKNTIIKTIKELQELSLIEVVSHFDSVKKTHSYNTYKVSQGVVQEINKGSAGDEQGVVQEMNKQKKTNTKETKQNLYDRFIEYLKANCKYKSKVTITKEGKELFNQIEDKKQLANDYIKHQEEKGDYAVRITKYMEDYNTVYKNKKDANNSINGWSY